MRIPVLIYTAVLSLMAGAALLGLARNPSPGAFLTAAGALLFVLSDALLARSLFGRGESPGSFRVMLSYLPAQALITLGFTLG